MYTNTKCITHHTIIIIIALPWPRALYENSPTPTVCVCVRVYIIQFIMLPILLMQLIFHHNTVKRYTTRCSAHIQKQERGSFVSFYGANAHTHSLSLSFASSAATRTRLHANPFREHIFPYRRHTTSTRASSVLSCCVPDTPGTHTAQNGEQIMQFAI